MKKLSILLSMVLMIFLNSCDMNITEIERQHNLEYITVDTSNNVKLTYLVGEPLKTTGIKVIGHYSDETEKEEDIRLVTFSEMDNTKPSDGFPITVNYEGKEASYNIVILEAQVESISIQLPQKLFYQINEQLDTTGLKIYGKYTNGVTLELEETQYVIDSVDLSEYGPHWVYVRLASDLHISEAYKIEVQDFTINSIKVTTKPKRLIYMAGEELDLTGMVVTAETDKGEISTLNEGQFTFSPTSIKNLEPSEEVKITINVNDAKDDFDIIIVPGYVIGAVVTNKGAKEQIQDSNIIYCEGEIFKLEDYDFYELLSNEKLGNPIEYNNLQCDINNKAFDKAGVNTVKIKYNFEDVSIKEQKEYTIEMKVCVVDSELESIEAVWDEKAGYPLGISPDNSNPENYGKWKVIGNLKNGTTIPIDPNCCTYDFTISMDNVRQAKDKILEKPSYFDVTVKYTDIRVKRTFECVGKVKVTPPILTNVKVDNYPTKLTYCCGDIVELNGLEVREFYSDGSNSIKAGFVSSQIIDDRTNKIVLTFSNDLSIDIPITVINPDIIGISITKKLDAGNIRFRKGKVYDNKVFYEKFSVIPISNSNIINQSAQPLESNVYFSIDIENHRVNAVYKLNTKEVTYSAYCDIGEQSILPALPKSVQVKHPEDESEIESIENYIKKLNLLIEYEDGKPIENLSYSHENNCWSDGVGNYKVTKVDGNNIEITFNANEKDVIEDKNSITFKLPFIKGIKISPKENNNRFRYNREDYKSFYDVYMLFVDAKDRKINDTKKLSTITASFDKTRAMVEPYIDGYIIVNYKDTYNNTYNNTYSYVYEGAKFYPSQPDTIKIQLNNSYGIIQTKEKFEMAHYYEITYKDGTTYDSSKGGETQKEICSVSSDFDNLENVSITYEINNPFYCVKDVVNQQGTRNYTISSITVEPSTCTLTNENMNKKEKEDFVKGILTSLECKYMYDNVYYIIIDRIDKKDDFKIEINPSDNNAKIFLSSNPMINAKITLKEPSTSSEVHQ